MVAGLLFLFPPPNHVIRQKALSVIFLPKEVRIVLEEGRDDKF